MKTVSFDIETGPLDDEAILRVCGPFDPSTVKVGNAGPEKAAEKIAEARASYLNDLREKAALDPLLGRVLVIGIGYLDVGGVEGSEGESDEIEILHEDADERTVLRTFWAAVRLALDGAARMVSFNGHEFDLPFLVGRSRLLGVSLPGGLMVQGGRYWAPCFFDLMKLWTCNAYGRYVSLDKLAKAFGIGGKNGDGAMFHKLWHGTTAEREQAVAYLQNDIAMLNALARKMEVV